MKLCALSVDLDEIPCYHAIHGLPEASGASAHAVYERAVPRYRELLDDLGVPCTFFVIGRDMKHAVARDGARALFDAGHELANHTQNHRYEFSRLDDDAIRDEIRGGIEAVAAVQGFAPSGFRAPGYTTNDRVMSALSELGVFYDSSVFPCPAYWAAKTTAIGLIRARGRRSHSIVDTPAVLAAPADPYVPARPYWRRAEHDGGIIELPIGVTRGARLPYIGTTVMLAGPSRVDLLTAQIAGRPLVNLELHGIDLLDEHDGLDALVAHQRDVRVPLARKLATLRRVVLDLQARGYQFVTQREAAQAFANEVRG
ncbi:MAG: polysaccharide deacetylase family protein [Polyangiales bacterium]